MLYVAAAQTPTAQLGAIKCDFYSREVDVVVINKLTRLEFHKAQEDGELEMVEDVQVWSGIAAIASVRLPGHDTSSVVVLTTCLKLFVLSYDPNASPKIQTNSSTSVLEPFGRISEYQAIRVDPLNRCLVVNAYDGLLRIVPIGNIGSKPSNRSSKSKTVETSSPLDLASSYNIRISNLNLASIAALSTPLDATPAVALVYTDHTGQKTLTTYNIDLDEKDVDEGPIQTETLLDPGSELCLSIPGKEGVLVVGEESIVYFPVENATEDAKGKRKAAEGRKAVKCRLPLARITSHAFVSAERLLLGDIFGKLFLIEIVSSSSGSVLSLKPTDLGDTTSPTAIVPLSPSLAYLASRFGDSQLVKLPEPNEDSMQEVEEGASNDLELLASYPNLAPIVDSCIVGGEGGAAGYVVSCSGAYKSGSLRVVRRGVGYTELASLDVEGVQRLWSLGSRSDAQYLVLGFFNSTTVLRVSKSTEGDEADLDVEEAELAPFRGDVATLHAAELSGTFVQVTADQVNITATEGDMVDAWVPQGSTKITSAASTGSHLVVAVQGGQAVLLEVEGGRIVQRSTTSFETDIASIAVTDTPAGPLAVVALWTSQTVHLLSIPDLRMRSVQTIATTYLIRSVLLTTFADGATVLFCGLGDGSLVSMSVDASAPSIEETTTKTVILGNRPFLLSEFSQGGKGSNVFACSDRPTVISRTKDRLVYSSVNVEDVSAVAPLDFSSSSALAVASPSTLRLGRIDAIQQVDIRTVPLDEDEPRRIAHDPGNRTFGILCSKRDVDRSTGARNTVSSMRLLSEESFTPRASVNFGPNEEGQGITRVSVDESTFFAVGTALIVEGSASEPEKGRLLVYSQPGMDSVEQVAEVEINGCPFAVVDLGGGYIAAAVNSQVCVYSFEPSGRTLSLVATWSGAFIALTLALGPNSTLVVGDALRSITLLKFTSSPRPKLEEVAKDYRSRYMVAVESLASNSSNEVAGTIDLIGAETDLNLFTVQYDSSSATGRLEDAGTLAARGGFHLGEMVSRFRHGIFGQQYGDSSGVAQPKLVFTTSAGSIGIVAELDSTSSKLLSDLERNMRYCVDGVGGLSQETFRSFKTDKRSTPSTGFIDGNFVQQFLDFPSSEQDRIIQGRNEHETLTAGKVEIVRVLEEVGRLH